ncbi:MAG: acyl-protein synthetase [Eubacteriales bacterium]|nr:acyl-protein synthetase [Eubacteriales bacterium]
MIDQAALVSMPPYGLTKAEKHAFLTAELTALTKHHAAHCPEYAKMLAATGVSLEQITAYEQLPPLPVRLFKEFSLKSVPDEALYKTVTSSGTTGQQVSRIYLDRDTATLQSKVLAKIMESTLGGSRLPMIIVDSPAVVKDRAMFSARGAGILGFSIFGRDRVYALDENMRLDLPALRVFLQKHESETIFLFGFTFIIWQHFYWELKQLGETLPLQNAVLLHGGGWKKLSDQAVSREGFRDALREVCGVPRVLDYYGMAEQTGSIYVECEHGHLHAPVWSDIVVRRAADFSVADVGETGLIEVASVLPRSYPGHVLLTEDEGRVLGEDDCPCGRKGKYFEVLGRVKRAETRGCSDTYEQR